MREIIFTRSGLLVTAGIDCATCTSDVSTGEIVSKYYGHSNYLSYAIRLYSLKKSPHLIVSADSDAWCSIRDATSAKPLALLPMEAPIIGINETSDTDTLVLIDTLGTAHEISARELSEIPGSSEKIV